MMTTPSPITPMAGQPTDAARNRARPGPAESPSPTVAEPTPADQVPAYSASERPVTRGERIAFQLWIVCTLLTLVGTLLFYLIDKIWG
jgi:hypothetical protein